MNEHVHFRDTECTDSCPHFGGSYQVIPREWPQDAEDVAEKISKIRFDLTTLRGEIDDLIRTVNDHDAVRSLTDSRGTVQGAIVLLYHDLERFRIMEQQRNDLTAIALESEGS